MAQPASAVLQHNHVSQWPEFSIAPDKSRLSPIGFKVSRLWYLSVAIAFQFSYYLYGHIRDSVVKEFYSTSAHAYSYKLFSSPTNLTYNVLNLNSASLFYDNVCDFSSINNAILISSSSDRWFSMSKFEYDRFTSKSYSDTCIAMPVTNSWFPSRLNFGFFSKLQHGQSLPFEVWSPIASHENGFSSGFSELTTNRILYINSWYLFVYLSFRERSPINLHYNYQSSIFNVSHSSSNMLVMNAWD